MRWLPKGYGGERRPADEIKREGWREQGILVIAAEDGASPGPSARWSEGSARNSTGRGPPNRGWRVAKRRKRAPKGKARAQCAKPEAMRLPGGRKLETVRVADPEGRPVTHGRTVDTLARMRRAGTITRAMHDAARDFQAHFTIAAFDAVPTASIVRVRQLRGEKMTWNYDLIVRQSAERDRVHDALAALGGMSSPGGSCVWHVVGLQMSLREWAMQQGWNNRPVRLSEASSILISALGMLAVNYGYKRPRRAS